MIVIGDMALLLKLDEDRSHSMYRWTHLLDGDRQ